MPSLNRLIDLKNSEKINETHFEKTKKSNLLSHSTGHIGRYFDRLRLIKTQLKYIFTGLHSSETKSLVKPKDDIGLDITIQSSK